MLFIFYFFFQAAICIYYQQQNKRINITAGGEKWLSSWSQRAQNKQEKWAEEILLKQMYGFKKRHEQGDTLSVTDTLANQCDSGRQ